MIENLLFIDFYRFKIAAIYSVLTKKISSFEYSTIQTTRTVFGYGLLFMIPATFLFEFSVDFEKIVIPRNFLNLLFLGVGASALCFVTWNFAIKSLGVVKTSAYIYAVPVITVATAHIVLGESVTPLSLCGMILALFGLCLSQNPSLLKKKFEKEEITE